MKETYDNNVYLQDNAPNPANVAAAQAAGLKPVEANKGSFVTTILPKVSLDYKPCSGFNLSLGYAPEIAFYHSTPDEDYVTHRALFNFGGKLGDATWELLNTATYIDGSTKGPTFARPDDIPAIGGIPLRDRRAAFIFRNGFRLTEPVGKWFFRPVATAYIHDFKTAQRPQPSSPRFTATRITLTARTSAAAWTSVTTSARKPFWSLVIVMAARTSSQGLRPGRRHRRTAHSAILITASSSAWKAARSVG